MVNAISFVSTRTGGEVLLVLVGKKKLLYKTYAICLKFNQFPKSLILAEVRKDQRYLLTKLYTGFVHMFEILPLDSYYLSPLLFKTS